MSVVAFAPVRANRQLLITPGTDEAQLMARLEANREKRAEEAVSAFEAIAERHLEAALVELASSEGVADFAAHRARAVVKDLAAQAPAVYARVTARLAL